MAANKSPNIIFSLKAHTPWSATEENCFYRCKGSKNIIDYINRCGAIDKSDPESQAILDLGMDLTDDSANSILSYATNRPGSTGSFNKDKQLSPEELKKLEKKLQTTGSIIWSSVVSLTPEIAEKCCYNKNMAQEIIKTNLPTLFKNSHLNYDNIDWFGAFHTNTKNPHIHLVFWEKEPKHIDSYGELGYSKKFKINDESLRDFKFCMNREFSGSKLDYHDLRDDIRHSMRLNYNNDKRTYNKYYSKCEHLLEKGKSQYGRLNSSDRKLIDLLVQDIVKNNPKLKSTYDAYTTSLFKTQVQYTRLYKENNMQVPQKVKEFHDSRLLDLHGRLGNEFLKMMKDYGANQKMLDHAVKKELGNPTKLAGQSGRHSRIKKITSGLLDQTEKILWSFSNSCESEIYVAKNTLDKFRREELMKGVELIHEEDEDVKE